MAPKGRVGQMEKNAYISISAKVTQVSNVAHGPLAFILKASNDRTSFSSTVLGNPM
jgi:hypothetical protein